jgi:hypothetical protein
MASDKWLFNEASVASGNTFAKVGSSGYTIVNNNAGTLTRTTTNPTPYEGAGCYVNGQIGGVNYFLRSYGYDTSEPLYLDAYFYIKSSTWSGNAAVFLEGDFEYFQVFTWCSVNAGSIEYGSYDPVNGGIYYNTTAYSVPLNAWIRCRAKTGYYGIEQFGIFTGSNINGSTPSLALPTINFSTLSAYAPTATYINESANANSLWIDNLKLDTATYPTRGNEQWLLNDTSVANGAYFTPVGLSDYKLQNNYGSTVSRTTSSPSPYEGAGCYASSGNYASLPIVNADNSAITDTGAKYADFYVYFNANPATNAHSPMGSGNNAAVEFGSVGVLPNGSVALLSYDAVFGTLTYGTSTAAGFITPGSWMRFQVKVGQKVVEEVKIYKTTINGTTPDATLTGTKYSGTKDGISFGQSPTGEYHWLDDIKFSDTAYPTRSSNQTITGTGIASTVTFGTAKVNRTVPITGVASTVVFGTAVVSVASTTKTLSPSGIASTVAFGTAQLNRTVPTEGIASSNAFGTAQLNQTLTTTGIASTVAFGTASVLPSQIVTTTGIASTTTFGTPQVNLSLSATGIASTTSFGTAQLNFGISLTGIASTNAFGTAQLTVFVPVTGIPSATTFGVAQVNLGVTTVGIGSTSALGSPQLNLTIVDVGAIASTIVFGTAEVGGTVPNLVGRRSSVAGSAGRTSATGATGRTTLV